MSPKSWFKLVRNQRPLLEVAARNEQSAVRKDVRNMLFIKKELWRRSRMESASTSCPALASFASLHSNRVGCSKHNAGENDGRDTSQAVKD